MKFLAFLLALIAAFGLYPMTGIVTELNETDDTVTVETATGFRFAFYGVEDWQIGDFASCIMYDNGTDEITDDAILTVRYAGHFE